MCYGTDFRNTRIGVQLVLFGSRVVVLKAQDQVIHYWLWFTDKATLFMLNVKFNWFFLKLNNIVPRKVGVFSCHEPKSQKNKKLYFFVRAKIWKTWTGTGHYVVKTCLVSSVPSKRIFDSELALLVTTRAVCLVYDLDQEKEQAKQELLSGNQKKSER